MLQHEKSKICDCCGIGERLEVDHINENHQDDSAGNHQTLCKYCHTEKSRDRDLCLKVMEACKADPRLKSTVQQASMKWLRKIKDKQPRPATNNPQLKLLSHPEPYTVEKTKLIIAGIIRNNPDIDE